MDSAQESVVHAAGVSLVLAVPGSGKTSTLCSRVCRLLRAGANPRSILCLTFTKAAQEEMVSRIIREARVPALAVKKQVRTFHSLGYSILKEFRPSRVEKVLTGPGQRRLLARCLSPGLYLGQARHAVASWKRALITPTRAVDEAAPGVQEALAQTYQRYEQALLDEKSIDFEGLIYEPVKLLLSDSRARDTVRSRIRHLLVDEFQDTTPSQQQLARLVFGGACALFVGDYNQSIYSFAGANCEAINDFGDHFPEHTVKILNVNYRSTPEIVECFKGAVTPRGLGAVSLRHMKSDKPSGPPPEFVLHESDWEEAEWLEQKVSALVRLGVPGERIAALFRTNAQLRPVEECFVRNGLSFKSPGTGFYGRKEVKVLAAAFMVATGHKGNWQTEIISRARLPRLRGLSPAQIDYSLRGQGYPDPARTVTALCECLGYVEWLRSEDDQEDGDNDAIWNVECFRQSASRWVSCEGFAEFLDKVYSRTADKDSVTLSTIHGAKGREWDHVFVCGVTEGILPHRKGDPAEEERVLYVGLSRARRMLHVSGWGEPAPFLKDRLKEE